MKTLFLSFLAIIPFATLSATPERSVQTSDRFVGSNNEVYAVVQTVTDNLGSYYSWREIKTFIEYSKDNGVIISQDLISDINFDVDVNHLDPNTPPKITEKVNKVNKTLLVSTIVTNYRNSASITPTWLNRLKWKADGLYFDNTLRLISKHELGQKELQLEAILEAPKNRILQVFRGRNSYYFIIRAGLDEDINTRVFHLSPILSKQLDDQSTKKTKYLQIASFETKEKANTQALKIIEQCNEKDFFDVNFEIWSMKQGNKTIFALVHHELLSDALARFKSIIKLKIQPTTSSAFIQKWIPFDPTEQELQEGEDIEGQGE